MVADRWTSRSHVVVVGHSLEYLWPQFLYSPYSALGTALLRTSTSQDSAPQHPASQLSARQHLSSQHVSTSAFSTSAPSTLALSTSALRSSLPQHPRTKQLAPQHLIKFTFISLWRKVAHQTLGNVGERAPSGRRATLSPRTCHCPWQSPWKHFPEES